jgi:pimeloyl-ACP methyl ester carboxylesterase
MQGEAIERIHIPHESMHLPAIRLTPENKNRGVILVHGGFDSFIEELFYILKYLSLNGFEVIGFEGPGQGHVLLKQGFPMDYRWEKPVASVLDHFNIDQAAIFGISMGGWFCLRAAAFEERIKKVIAAGHAYDYMKIPPAIAEWLMMFFYRNFRNYTNNSMLKMLKKGGMQAWQLHQLMHVTRSHSPIEALEFSMQLNEENLHSERVTQDVLYLTGRNDHFIPFKMRKRQVELLKNTASLTERVFTQDEHAQNHCQVGNIQLMLDTIIDWLHDRQ